mgnify:CR=1 FL=1
MFFNHTISCGLSNNDLFLFLLYFFYHSTLQNYRKKYKKKYLNHKITNFTQKGHIYRKNRLEKK